MNHLLHRKCMPATLNLSLQNPRGEPTTIICLNRHSNQLSIMSSILNPYRRLTICQTLQKVFVEYSPINRISTLHLLNAQGTSPKKRTEKL